MSSEELLERKRTLTLRRDELLARLNAIKADIGRGLDADWEEQAIQLENAEVLSEISRVTAEELNKVDAAIHRLEQAINQHA
jgi:RNA polymerase-binding transcription factor DksA